MKVSDKMDKVFKKTTTDKKKFTNSIDAVFNDPFFKPKTSPKARDNEEFNFGKVSKTSTVSYQDINGERIFL